MPVPQHQADSGLPLQSPTSLNMSRTTLSDRVQLLLAPLLEYLMISIQETHSTIS
jgi:hypothetical protein